MIYYCKYDTLPQTPYSTEALCTGYALRGKYLNFDSTTKQKKTVNSQIWMAGSGRQADNWVKLINN